MEQESAVDLAMSAVRGAAADADIRYDDIEMLIVATCTAPFQAPSMTSLVHGRLGLRDVPAFDVSAVCSGFMFALAVGGNILAASKLSNIVVVGPDAFSKVTDWARRDCVFFGDGAGAIVLTASEDAPARFEIEISTKSSGWENFMINRESGLFEMNGKAVYDDAVSMVPMEIERMLTRAGLIAADISVVVPHQPAWRLLAEIARRVAIPFERFVLNMRDYANTGAATVPMAQYKARQEQRLRSGDNILLTAVGAGMTAATATLRWLG